MKYTKSTQKYLYFSNQTAITRAVSTVPLSGHTNLLPKRWKKEKKKESPEWKHK